MSIEYVEGDVVYYLKDHLGNIRVTVDETGSVVTADDYYPFGLQMPGRSYNVAFSGNQYKFGSKELDDENNLNLYHFEARRYDPVIARFISVDPLAEQTPAWTPYRYAFNNPLRYIDPTGMGEDDPWYQFAIDWWNSLTSDDDEEQKQKKQDEKKEEKKEEDVGLIVNKNDYVTHPKPAAKIFEDVMKMVLGKEKAKLVTTVTENAENSTGRTVPKNLIEQLALKAVMSNPDAGETIPVKGGMKDERWPASEGWEKQRQNVNGVEIHYVKNKKTGEVADFKFKDD